MKKDSALINELKMFAKLTKGSNMGAFHQAMLDSAKVVKVSPCKDVLTAGQIRIIKNVIKPKMKECYKNATMLSSMIGCEYVEGMMLCFLGIEHAFNKVGDKYIDITNEFALGNNPSDTEYVSIGEYSKKEAMDVAIKTGYYGNVFRQKFVELLDDKK